MSRASEPNPAAKRASVRGVRTIAVAAGVIAGGLAGAVSVAMLARAGFSWMWAIPAVVVCAATAWVVTLRLDFGTLGRRDGQR